MGARPPHSKNSQIVQFHEFALGILTYQVAEAAYYMHLFLEDQIVKQHQAWLVLGWVTPR